MDITKFTVNKYEEFEYPYRILVYPNITYQRDLTRDSYVIVMQNVLKHLSVTRPDIYWVLLLPYHLSALDFPNVEQRILPMPTYPNTMRTHFNALQFLDVIDWKTEDYDIVYSHLPEHTAQLANVFVNGTNIYPKFIGYCHWFEVPENTAYEKTMLWSNLAGILEMQECGVNSEWLKKFILHKFGKMVTPEVVFRLNEIIQPHYLGIDGEDIQVNRKTFEPKTAIFNHRPNEYTGWNWFVKSMDKLWEKRQDFKVYTTLASINRPWNEAIDCKTRSEYLDFLHSVPQFGLGCFQDYSAWSISTTDGLSQGVPYLLPAGLCYPEMVGKSYPLLYHSQDEFLTKFEHALDDQRFTDEVNLDSIVKMMTWDSRVGKWFSNWKNVFDFTDYTLKSRSDAYLRIVDFIRKKKRVSKGDIIKHLNWGMNIRWSPYRNMLRNEDDIKFTLDHYEVR